MSASTNPTQDPQTTNQVSLILESRPIQPIVARYETLPFPLLAPRQEVAIDLGITAYGDTITLGGVVLQGYHDHQQLVEERWPARILLQHTRQPDLTIPAGTGLAVRNLMLQLRGYELLTSIMVTAVGTSQKDGQSIQATLQIPVRSYTQKTDLHFPLRGTWWAIQGSDWSDQHKQEIFSQAYAIDFVKLGSDNQFFRNNGLTLEDHYSWDQPVYATSGGKVAYVAYDMPDLPPGTPPDPVLFRDDVRRVLGNAVAISHGNGEFSYYGHLQQASLQVNEGQLIRRGTLLGRVGNSGHSPGPHLHFHLMQGPNLFIDQGLPVQFSHFSAGGQFFEQLTTIPTRMIVTGPTETENEEQ